MTNGCNAHIEPFHFDESLVRPMLKALLRTVPAGVCLADVQQLVTDMLKPEHAPYLITVSPACAEIAAKLLTERKAT